MLKISILMALVFLCLANSVRAQVVQLPTFSNFGYSGTVVVPDSGATSLGSVARARSNQTSSGFWPFAQRGAGRDTMLSSASAHATIIDLAEMDRQILGGTPEEFMRRQRALGAAEPSRILRPATSRALSNEEASASVASEPKKPQDPVEAAKKLVRDARKASRDGFIKAADYYYRSAIRQLPKDLAGLAQIEYQRFLVMRRPALKPQIGKQ